MISPPCWETDALSTLNKRVDKGDHIIKLNLLIDKSVCEVGFELTQFAGIL